MFHKEGFKIIFFTGLIVVTGVLMTDYFVSNYWLQKSIMMLFVILFVLVLQFFRDPKRNTLLDDLTIIAPADGKVVVLEEVEVGPGAAASR